MSQLDFRLDSSTLWQGFRHLFGYFRWLALTSRVLLDLGLFWDCDFVLWSLFVEPLYDFCSMLASLQIPDKTGERGER